MKKLDLIVAALELAKEGWQCFDEYEKALAAARELRALKPLAWITDDYEQDRSAITFNAEVAKRWQGKGWRVAPLYAIDDEVTEYAVLAEREACAEVNQDLLEALKVLVENGGIGSEDMFDDARAAIAKATGEQA